MSAWVPIVVWGRLRTFCLSNIIIKSMQKGMNWKRPQRRSCSNPSAIGRDTSHYTKLPSAPSSPALNSAWDGASAASLGSLCQCLTTLIEENVFLIYNLNMFSFSLKPLPLVMSLHSLIKGPSSAFLWVPFRYWEAAIRYPQSLLLPRLNNPNKKAGL